MSDMRISREQNRFLPKRFLPKTNQNDLGAYGVSPSNQKDLGAYGVSPSNQNEPKRLSGDYGVSPSYGVRNSFSGAWGTDYETILEQIRQNCVYQATLHKKKYFFYVKLNQYFRLPTIFLSALTSVSAIGLQPYLAQQHISGLVCLVSLSIGVINSIEIFLKISETCETELETSKLFYHLATDIHKTLSLDQENRPTTGKECLDEIYRRYVELMEKSNLLRANYKDTMINLPKKKLFSRGLTYKSPISSSSSSSSSSQHEEAQHEEAQHEEGDSPVTKKIEEAQHEEAQHEEAQHEEGSLYIDDP